MPDTTTATRSPIEKIAAAHHSRYISFIAATTVTTAEMTGLCFAPEHSYAMAASRDYLITVTAITAVAAVVTAALMWRSWNRLRDYNTHTTTPVPVPLSDEGHQHLHRRRRTTALLGLTTYLPAWLAVTFAQRMFFTATSHTTALTAVAATITAIASTALAAHNLYLYIALTRTLRAHNCPHLTLTRTHH